MRAPRRAGRRVAWRWPLRIAVACAAVTAILLLATTMLGNRGTPPATAAEIAGRAQAALDDLRSLTGRARLHVA